MSIHDWKTEVRRRLREAPLDGEQQAAMIEEIAQDLESHHEALLRQGIGDPAATEQVLASLDHDRGLWLQRSCFSGCITRRREALRSSRSRAVG